MKSLTEGYLTPRQKAAWIKNNLIEQAGYNEQLKRGLLLIAITWVDSILEHFPEKNISHNEGFESELIPNPTHLYYSKVRIILKEEWATL